MSPTTALALLIDRLATLPYSSEVRWTLGALRSELARAIQVLRKSAGLPEQD